MNNNLPSIFLGYTLHDKHLLCALIYCDTIMLGLEGEENYSRPTVMLQTILSTIRQYNCKYSNLLLQLYMCNVRIMISEMCTC